MRLTSFILFSQQPCKVGQTERMTAPRPTYEIHSRTIPIPPHWTVGKECLFSRNAYEFLP